VPQREDLCVLSRVGAGSRASQLSTRTSIKYASLKATVSDHAGLAGTVTLRVDPVEGAVQGR